MPQRTTKLRINLKISQRSNSIRQLNYRTAISRKKHESLALRVTPQHDISKWKWTSTALQYGYVRKEMTKGRVRASLFPGARERHTPG